MLDLIDSAGRSMSNMLKANPNQKGTRDVVANDAFEAALAATQTSELFDFTMNLLNLVTPTTRLLCRWRPALSQIVGNDEIALPGREVEAKEFHREVRSSLEMDQFAAAQFLSRPNQLVDATPCPTLIGGSHIPVVFERTVKSLLMCGDILHFIRCRIPCVHRTGTKLQLLVNYGVVQHLAHVIEFALVVAFRIIYPVIDQPKLPALWVHIHARHHPDPVDHRLGVPAPLRPHQRHRLRMSFVNHHVIKDHHPLRTLFHFPFHVLPHQSRCQPISSKIPVHLIVAVFSRMRSEVRQRVIALRTQQVLAIRYPTRLIVLSSTFAHPFAILAPFA